jgi:uncharacterized protein (TIGR02996 family)
MHQEFLQTIIQNPEDDAPRLVYADWLEEHGDADRAEFIRVQCELAKLDESDPQHLSLFERSSELHQAHRMKWAEPLNKLAKWLFFERGFVNRIGICAQTLLENAEAIFRSAPIQGIGLLGSAGFIEELTNCHYLTQITELDVHADRYSLDVARGELHPIGDRGLAALAKCPYLGRVRKLDLRDAGSTVHGIRLLTTSLHLASLEHLDLSSNDVGALGLAALTASPCLSGLTALELVSTGMDDRTLRDLASSRLLAGLTELSVGFDRIGSRGLRALLSSPQVAGLTKLRLSFTPKRWRGGPSLGDVGAMLAASSFLGRLRTLDLRGTDIEDAGLEAILNSACSHALTELQLSENGITPVGTRALASWLHLSQLTKVDLSNNPIGDDGLEAILHSRHLGRPNALMLAYVGITDRGAEALAACANLDRLTVLFLFGNTIGNRGREALLARFGKRVHFGDDSR